MKENMKLKETFEWKNQIKRSRSNSPKAEIKPNGCDFYKLCLS